MHNAKHLQEHFAGDAVLTWLVPLVAADYQPRGSSFGGLAEIVIGQQLSKGAVTSILRRVRDAAGGEITARWFADAEGNDLRNLGVSPNKGVWIKGIAEAALADPELFERLAKMTYEDALRQLIAFKGVGHWTANVFLLFNVGIPDVFCPNDVTLEKAIAALYGTHFGPDTPERAALLSRWAPYRSFACLALWRWVDDGMVLPGEAAIAPI